MALWALGDQRGLWSRAGCNARVMVSVEHGQQLPGWGRASLRWVARAPPVSSDGCWCDDGSQDRRTALSTCVIVGSAEVAGVLLDRGANVEAKDRVRRLLAASPHCTVGLGGDRLRELMPCPSVEAIDASHVAVLWSLWRCWLADAGGPNRSDDGGKPLPPQMRGVAAGAWR